MRASRRDPWLVGALGVLLVGVALRLVLGGGDVGDRSAGVMTALVAVSAWLVAWLLTRTPKVAFVAVLVVVIAFDIAALPARNPPEYDDREPLFRTDQVLAKTVPVPTAGAGQQLLLTVLAEPVFPRNQDQPSFGLGASIGGTDLAWKCTFARGVQRFALPLPASATVNESNADVRLRLTGSPTRENDYLLVYASSGAGGYLFSIVPVGVDSSGDATRCTLG